MQRERHCTAQRAASPLQEYGASGIRPATVDLSALRVQAKAQRSARAARETRVAERRTGTGQKVLIVEDDFDNRFVMARLLTGAGYTALEASDGEEAIEIAQRERPVLILMDLALPRMDGWEATRRIKADP